MLLYLDCNYFKDFATIFKDKIAIQFGSFELFVQPFARESFHLHKINLTDSILFRGTYLFRGTIYLNDLLLENVKAVKLVQPYVFSYEVNENFSISPIVTRVSDFLIIKTILVIEVYSENVPFKKMF